MKSIIFMQGGLGNQMFQYAFFLSMSTRYQGVIYNTQWYDENSCHNGYELERLFGIPPRHSKWELIQLRIVRKLNRIGIHLPNIILIQDTLPSSYKQYAPQPSINFFDGYWQSEKFFSHIKRSIRKRFQWDFNKLNKRSTEVLYAIRQTPVSVSLHVRRGDYLDPKISHLYTGICNERYYSHAIKRMKSLHTNVTFFVFSDDIEWVREHLPLDNAQFVSHNRDMDSWQDMLLMSQCDHNIIANSSFSWWGAWLNHNTNKTVIAPAKFINTGDNSDIVPESWILI